MNNGRNLAPDPKEIRRALEVLYSPGDVVELRVLEAGGNTKRIDAGYFNDFDALAQAADKCGCADALGVYVTLNVIDPSLLARAANRVKQYARTATADSNILRRRWLLVDCDPARLVGISSTAAEFERAKKRAQELRDGLRADGWPAPVPAISGNGFHLLYRIDEPNDPGTTAVIEACLKALDRRFGDNEVHIDKTVFNAARITKMYGTPARKGDATDERPHRLSRLLELPEAVGIVTREFLEKLASKAPEPAKKPHTKKPSPSGAKKASPFNLEDFIARNNIKVRDGRAGIAWNDDEKWELDECPFNPEHTSGAFIARKQDGALIFKCQHDSCSGKDWAALRELREPKAERGGGGEAFEVDDNGDVYHRDLVRGKEWVRTKVCGPLRCIGMRRTGAGGAWARLMEFEDWDGRTKTAVVPIAGDAGEHRDILAGFGCQVLAPDRKINSLLAKYVSSLATDAREIVVDKTGWYGDAFVLPERTFGDMSGDRYVLSDLPDNPYAVAGTLAEWQASVGSLCRGNPQLVFAVSAGFSAMLAPFADVASNMGFHFHGHSSMGKSTALYAAGSVWGHRPDSKDGYLNSWRTTNNALEGTALLFNYTLLCMDEIKSNMDLSNIGAMMLMLGNGSNKGRMRVNDTKREPKSWRTTTLSSGESTMVACARAAGGEMQGGEQIRMLDIPTQPFIDLHGRSGPDVFSKAVVAAACTNYGTASRAFLSYLTGPYGYQTKLGYCGLMAGILSRWRREMMGGDDPTTGRVPFPAEVGRAAEHFAAVAAAGEDATQRHITGWPPGEAADAAHTMFKAWLDARGHTGAADANTSQEFVRGLIRQHGASRFQQEESENSFRTVQNSLGHTWMHDGDPVYFFCEGDSFSKECKLAKLDPRKVWKEVNAAGWPVLKSTGRNTYEKRFKDRTKPSGYVVRLPEDRGADADAAAERAERGKAVELERERLSSAAPGTQVRGF